MMNDSLSTVDVDPALQTPVQTAIGAQAAHAYHERRIAARPRRSVRIRPIAASDAAAYVSILERTTPEDRYCRFFHVVNHFSRNEISRFVEPQTDTIAFIAEENSQPLGVAHLFFSSPASAELAIVVA